MTWKTFRWIFKNVATITHCYEEMLWSVPKNVIKRVFCQLNFFLRDATISLPATEFCVATSRVLKFCYSKSSKLLEVWKKTFAFNKDKQISHYLCLQLNGLLVFSSWLLRGTDARRERVVQSSGTLCAFIFVIFERRLSSKPARESI